MNETAPKGGTGGPDQRQAHAIIAAGMLTYPGRNGPLVARSTRSERIVLVGADECHPGRILPARMRTALTGHP